MSVRLLHSLFFELQIKFASKTVFLDYIGVSEEELVTKYIKTKEVYETLFLEEQKILLWPIAESRFKFTNEEMVHVDLYRMVV